MKQENPYPTLLRAASILVGAGLVLAFGLVEIVQVMHRSFTEGTTAQQIVISIISALIVTGIISLVYEITNADAPELPKPEAISKSAEIAEMTASMQANGLPRLNDIESKIAAIEADNQALWGAIDELKGKKGDQE